MVGWSDGIGKCRKTCILGPFYFWSINHPLLLRRCLEMQTRPSGPFSWSTATSAVGEEKAGPGPGTAVRSRFFRANGSQDRLRVMTFFNRGRIGCRSVKVTKRVRDDDPCAMSHVSRYSFNPSHLASPQPPI